LNADAATIQLLQIILIFIGTVITVGGGVFAVIWARRQRKDRMPIDERDDMKAQFEAMAIANRTVVDTMKATNEANDRIVRTLTEDKVRLDTLITDLNARLAQREADMNRLYKQREQHVEEVARLTEEVTQLRSDLDVATRLRDYLEQELKDALSRIDHLTPESLQDEIAKQRQSHHTNPLEIVEGGPTP